MGRLTEDSAVIARLFDVLPSVAVFKRSGEKCQYEDGLSDQIPGEEDELACYTCLKHGSDIGMTRTRENHRMKGLAKAATLRLAAEIHREGLPVSVIVDDGYDMSIDMHKRMGFKSFTKACIPCYYPSNFDFDTPSPIMDSLIADFPEDFKKWFDKITSKN